MFGGFGADNTSVVRMADGRLRSLVILSLVTGEWRVVQCEGSDFPPSREHHVSVLAGQTLWVFGGRTSPSIAFNDLWSFCLATRKWTEHKVPESGPIACYRHSAVLYDDKMVMFGGRTQHGFVNHLWVLDLKSGNWHKPACTNTAPSPRASHSAAVYNDLMYIFGGLQSGELADYCVDTEVYALDLKTWSWSHVPTTGPRPPALYSHSATVLGSCMVCAGGSSGDEVEQYTRVYVLDLTSFEWALASGSSRSLAAPSRGFFTKHTACAIGPSQLLLVGGGGLCFSFGTHFSPTVRVDLETTRAVLMPMRTVDVENKVEVTANTAHDASEKDLEGEVNPQRGAVCFVCGATFQSRNKLNAHVQLTKHNIRL